MPFQFLRRASNSSGSLPQSAQARILVVLDQGCRDFVFPILDNGYVYLAGTSPETCDAADYPPRVILRSMPSPIARLRDITEGQWGLVTLQQAREAGVAWPSLARQVETGLLERVAHGVYRLRGAPEPDHLALRAAWLQLDPAHPAWQRLDDPEVAVVSHSSAAAMYGVGDLRADVHEFTVPGRRQTRRPDVRIHRGRVPEDRRVIVGGLPVTRAGWTVGELLEDRVDPDAVAQITSEILDRVLDYPRVVVEGLSPYATRFGLQPKDGQGLLADFLLRAGDRDRERLLAEAAGW